MAQTTNSTGHRRRPSRGRDRFRLPPVLIAAFVSTAAATPCQAQAPREDPLDAPAPDRDPAEPAPPPVRLEPIVITATRTERPLFDVPAFTDVVTAQDISEDMHRTVPEALREIPGVMVQKTGHGQGSPFIRGFTGFRTLFLIDGIRLNNSVFRDGPNQYWNTVDPYSLQRLEVVKGPSSVLYGSDAIGGTVNAITKSPYTWGEGFGGRAYYRVSSAERSHTWRGELSLTWAEQLGLYGGGTYRQFGDLESGSGRLPKTGYDELDADFKIERRLDPDTRLVIAHQRVDLDDAWRTHSTVFAVPFDGSTVGDEQQRVLDQNRELTYVQLHAEKLDGFVDAAHFSASYHAQAEQRNRVRGDGRVDVQGLEVGTLGLSAQFETASDVGLWTYGIEYYRDEVDSYRTDFAADGMVTGVGIQGPVADDATYDLLGVYLQNEIPITEALDIILGGRFTWARADADSVEDPATGDRISITEDYDALVGSARFIYRLDEQERWALFGGVSQGFRAPNLSDLTRLDTARTNEIETPAPGLEPEHFISYEIGLKTRCDDRLFAQASYFHTDIDEMIIRQPTGDVIDGDNEVTKRNSGSGYVHGVELGASWRFHPRFTAFGSFAWQEGAVDTFPTSAPLMRREPIDRMMPATGRIGLRWESPERELWLEGVLTIAAGQERLSSRDAADTQRIPPGGTPGFTVLSFRGGWQVDEQLAVTAAVENITDEDYRIHGSGINEAGINVILGVEYRF